MSKPRASQAASAVALAVLLGACSLSSTKTVDEVSTDVAAAQTDATAPADAAPVAPAATSLSKSEAEALFANARARGTTATGVTYTITYKPDGTAALEWSYLTQSGRDVGKWRIADDGAVCKTWSQTDQGVEQCERVIAGADGTYRSIDAATGLDRSTFTIEAAV
jgi:hypothetical protein